jgi:hypothetical protein
MWDVWERGAIRRVFWWGRLSEGIHLEDLGVDGMIALKWIFRKWAGET